MWFISAHAHFATIPSCPACTYAHLVIATWHCYIVKIFVGNDRAATEIKRGSVVLVSPTVLPATVETLVEDELVRTLKERKQVVQPICFLFQLEGKEPHTWGATSNKETNMTILLLVALIICGV